MDEEALKRAMSHAIGEDDACACASASASDGGDADDDAPARASDGDASDDEARFHDERSESESEGRENAVRRAMERAVWEVVLRVCDEDSGEDEGADYEDGEREISPRLNHERESDVEAFRALLNSAKSLDLDVDAKTDDGDGALHLASLYGKTAFVKELIAAGATVTMRDESGGTPLHDACASGYLCIVHELCLAATKKGTISEYIRMRDEDGEECLHLAARGEHHEIVAYLLENGADARAKNSEGQTPADVCDDDALRASLRRHEQ